MVRYPSTLYRFGLPISTRDESGNWVTGPALSEKIAPCRAESNTQGATVMLADGTKQVYDVLLYLPQGTPAVAVGTTVEVRSATGEIQLRGPVKRFWAYQTYCSIWL